MVVQKAVKTDNRVWKGVGNRNNNNNINMQQRPTNRLRGTIKGREKGGKRVPAGRLFNNFCTNTN